MKYQSSSILKHLECHKGLLMNHRFESKGDHNDYSILLEPKIIDFARSKCGPTIAELARDYENVSCIGHYLVKMFRNKFLPPPVKFHKSRKGRSC